MERKNKKRENKEEEGVLVVVVEEEEGVVVVVVEEEEGVVVVVVEAIKEKKLS